MTERFVKAAGVAKVMVDALLYIRHVSYQEAAIKVAGDIDSRGHGALLRAACKFYGSPISSNGGASPET